jgi:hypothetical protein
MSVREPPRHGSPNARVWTGRALGMAIDALLSAWATRQGMVEGWQDLVGNDPSLLLPAGKVSHLWPKELAG